MNVYLQGLVGLLCRRPRPGEAACEVFLVFLDSIVLCSVGVLCPREAFRRVDSHLNHSGAAFCRIRFAFDDNDIDNDTLIEDGCNMC